MMFRFSAYKDVMAQYKADFNQAEWILVVIAISILVILVLLFIFILSMVIRKYARFRKKLVEQESMKYYLN